LVAQDWLKDTCALNGNVKSVRYESAIYFGGKEYATEDYRYEYNPQGFLIRSNLSSSHAGKNYNAYYRIYDETGKHCLVQYYIQSKDTASRYDFTYTNLGNVDKAILYNWGKRWSTYNYVYDEKNMLSEYFVVIHRDGDTIRNYFEYDEAGRIIMDAHISETYKKYKYWQYDSNGYLKEEKLLDSNWAGRTTYKMDNDGNVLDKETIDNSKMAYTKESYITKLIYNEQGQVSKETKTDFEGRLVTENIYTYNEEGFEATLISFYAAKEDKSEYTINFIYTYTYDSQGNWITKTASRNGEMFQEEKKKIEYY